MSSRVFSVSAALAVTFATLTSCTNKDNENDGANQPAGVTIEQIAAVLCDDAPVRMSADAEVYTAASYNCTHGAESVRVDLYDSEAQQAAARQVFLDFCEAAGDPRTLASLPLGCGTLWAFGVDYNETRDSLIVALNAGGIPTILCST